MDTTTYSGLRTAIGASPIRFDGPDKVRGRTAYVDDLVLPGLWHGAVVRSPVAHGKLEGLKFDPAFDWATVTVVTADDVPGDPLVHFFVKDMPYLASTEVHYCGEPVALVAAPDRVTALNAARAITVNVSERPACLTLDEVVAQYKEGDAENTLLWKQEIHKGKVSSALEGADQVVTGEYWCGHQEQLYLEPQGMMAVPEADGVLRIIGSMQCPYYIRDELPPALGIEPDKLIVEQAMTGGAFGGKEEYPTQLAGYCAFLALKSGRPVKIVYDRDEDIHSTPKRHPAWVRHTTGLNADGSIAAMKVEYLLDGGAYGTISPVVLFRGILHAGLAYRCENVDILGRVYKSHTVPCGAFRGFGAPQAIWALESHVDVLAEKLNWTPQQFRRAHAVDFGDTTPTGQVLNESMGARAVLERALEKADFDAHEAQGTRGIPNAAGRYSGVGMSFFGHGAGFTGDGEARLQSRAALDLERNSEGQPVVTIRVSSTEMGQGAATALPQVVADALKIDLAHVRYLLPDTSKAPNSGPTVASRTALVVGSILHDAALTLLEKLISVGGEGTPFLEAAETLLASETTVRVEKQFALPDSIKWNQETFEGDSYPCYSWGCNIVEVDIDPVTLEVRVPKIVAVFDVGRVINPMLAEGQAQGGLVQALGYSIMEKISTTRGRYDADRLQTYVIPTALDVAELDVEFVEVPYEFVGHGAKGLGEIPMDGLAPAVANAVQNALGVRLNRIPITPESLFETLQEQGRLEC